MSLLSWLFMPSVLSCLVLPWICLFTEPAFDFVSSSLDLDFCFFNPCSHYYFFFLSSPLFSYTSPNFLSWTLSSLTQNFFFSSCTAYYHPEDHRTTGSPHWISYTYKNMGQETQHASRPGSDMSLLWRSSR